MQKIMHKELFHISLPSFLSKWIGVTEVTVYSYAFCIVLGALLATVYTKWRAKKELNIDRLPNTFFYLIFIMGFVGGKLLYFLERPLFFMANPKLILANFSGGFVFYGSFITIIPFVVWYLKKYKLPVMPMLDILAVTTIIAHFFGRIGCFLGGCCYGLPTDTSLGIVFPNSNGVTVHPTQLYEATLLLVILFLILYVKKNKQFDGQQFLTYIILYGFCRIFLELFRGDERGYFIEGFISHSQGIAVLLIFIAIIYYKKILIQNFNYHENTKQ
jgi:phosphatidylglycerol:prolipoprotein diacylglycerol transferase